MARESELISHLAADVLDHCPVDWDLAEQEATPIELPLVRRLRMMAAMAGLPESLAASGSVPADTPESSASEAPRTWGQLRLLEEIGRGAFGRVYRAWDPRLDRRAALKLLDTDDGSSLALSTAVIEEGRLMARVRHPNVAAVYGADRIDGRAGLWMEFVDGVTLEQQLRTSGPFDAAEAARVGVDLCHALSAVHEAGLLHQDIKAQNVMREGGGRIVLMDFGAGIDQATAPAETSREFDAVMAGTPLYLAPERFAGGLATERSDIYSLGVLLYHLVTGSYPVAASTIDGVKRAHLEGRRTELLEAKPGLDTRLAAAVERAIDPDPQRRWASAAEFGGALLETCIPAIPPSRARNARPTIAAAALVAAIGAVAVAVNVGGVRDRLPWLGSWPGRARSAGNGGRVGVPAASPSARKLPVPPFITVGGPSLDGRYVPIVTQEGDKIAIIDVDTGASQALTGASSSMEDAGVVALALSPDGRFLAYSWSRGEREDLLVADIGGGQPRVLPGLQGADRFESLEWARDGRRILCQVDATDGSRTIALVDVADGGMRTIRRFAGALPQRASLSPDGRFIVYDLPATARDRHRDIYIVPVGGDSPVALVSHPADDAFPLWTPDGSGVFFIREVAGARDGWLQRVVNGRPQGEAVCVARGLGPVAPTGFTRDGALLYHFESGSSNLYQVRLSHGSDWEASTPEILPSRNAGFPHGPGWSRDGRFLAFVSTRGGMNPVSETRVIMIRDMQTGDERELEPPLYPTFQNLRWSSDDRTLLVSGSDVSQRWGAWIVNVSDGRVRPERAVAVDRLSNLGAYGPSIWSPDGRAVLYQHAARGLVRRDVASGAESVLVSYDDVPFGRINRFAYAADGRRMALSAPVSKAAGALPGTGMALFLRTPDGRCHELIRSSPGEFLSLQGWMPDGESILFSRWRAPNVYEQALWLIRAAGGLPRRLLTVRSDTWSQPVQVRPDGSALVFVAGETSWELWMMQGFLPAPFGNPQK